MVTVRAYLNSTDALVAKAHLDDHAIPCAMADEMAHLYGGAPFAMPLRLQVPEEHLAEATRVLEELDAATRDNAAPPSPAADDSVMDAVVAPEPAFRRSRPVPQPSVRQNNPWELLVIALLFFVPGLVLLGNDRVLVLLPPGEPLRADTAVMSSMMGRMIALIPIAIAAALTVLYFRTRAAIRRDQAAAAEDQAD
jgi:hypothetical protein